MSKNVKKSSAGFWAFYVILVLLLVGFWFFFLNGVIKKDMKIYEAAQPEHIMEDVVAKVQSGDLSDMNFAESSSRFEASDIYKEAFTNGIAGKTISFKKNPTSYDAQAPVYELYADDAHIATVTLNATSSKPLMFILSVQDWSVASVVPLYETGSEGITIKIPDCYTAYVNGVQVDERELAGEPKEYKDFEIVAKYVDVPKELTYSVTGLMAQPTVEVKDAAGNVISVEQNGSEYVAGFTGTEVPSDIADNAITNAKYISEVYAGDRTLSAIKPFLTSDSYLIPLFESYINHDLWMYSGHATPTYSNEAASEYVKYNDNFYSVVVYFDKTMYLPKRNMTAEVTTHNKYFYVNVDGKWVIADMLNMTEE
jgi:hypothetical protein